MTGSSLSTLEINPDGDGTFIFRPSKRVYSDKELRAGVAIQEEYTADHLKLLHLVSFHGKESTSPKTHETWIRETPMMVLIFEGIVAGLFDFDYAPCSIQLSVPGGQRRLWLNVSQEGKSACDDLRENRLLKGLKISTDDGLPITALQVSAKGQELLSIMPAYLLDEVSAFALASNGSVKRVNYNNEEAVFELEATASAGVGKSEIRVSEVTETEDVAYVSSPFLPKCLCSDDAKEMTDNSSRARESAVGTQTTMKQESPQKCLSWRAQQRLFANGFLLAPTKSLV